LVKHYNIKVYGLVHGVFFRVSAQEKAQELGLNGCVNNVVDGSVNIEAEGEEEQLKKFVEWCKKGPEKAQVTDVKVEEDLLQNYSNFVVKR
jgi:acylphosphatase